MPAGLRIRPAHAGDVPTIHALVRGLAEYEKLLDTVTATEAGLREHLFGPRPAAEVALAEDGEACVGYALWFTSFSTFVGRPGIYLEDIYVPPAHRGRGIGRALMVWVARVAHERGCGRLEWSVLDWNTPAREFYRGLGARALEQWIGQRMTGEAIARLATEPLPGEGG